MITVSDAARSVLGRSFVYHVRVESWLGGELLADDIPIVSGSEDSDRALSVPERVSLSVPRLDRGVTWSPVSADHPLAANGQRLKVSLGIGVGGGVVEWLTRGWVVVESAVTRGDVVDVTGVGLLSLIEEARLVSPFQPSGTLGSTLRGLVEPALTVDLSAAPTDRSVPAGMNWDEDRLGAVYELLDAWPADITVDPEGFLAVTPTSTGSPVGALTDGAGGTAVSVDGESTREGAANVVVARGNASDGGQVQGVAYDTAGPKRMGGPFNPLPVPTFYYSPLLTTVAQCNAAAATILARRKRETARRFTAECVPDPTLVLGDVLTVTTAELDAVPCSVESLTLPYTASGTMGLMLREVD